VDPASILERAAERLSAPAPGALHRVLNATGVIIHTHLGRAPLDPSTGEALLRAAHGYTDLELDLRTGRRGSRGDHVEPVLIELTGAEAALVVNNNAAAVLLALETLARGREVVISRGELVEIGGSFRIPDILVRSGARLREVGTTNRTHARDYESAMGPESALVLKVHPSNFRMEGFTKSVPEAALVQIAHAAGIPLAVDLGSGTTVDLRALGLPGEPPVQACLRAGADLVMFSGDKLLGGPQAGIVLGRRELVERMRRNPLARALRIDKLTLAVLAQTLRTLLDPVEAVARIPVLRMLTVPGEALDSRARKLARLVRRALGRKFQVTVEDGVSRLGGGAWALADLPSRCVVVRSEEVAAHKLEERIRAATPPVLARVHEGALWLDLRTLEDRDLEAVAGAFPPDFR
jgi:L-seryl-tRNA(Ser) seleniumtransferase